MASLPTSTSYGSLGDVNSGSAPHYAGQETSPLLGPKRRARSLRKWMKADISRDRADVVLLLSYIITGLLDSASISTWGTFVSMQTGTLHLHFPPSSGFKTNVENRKHRLSRPRTHSRHQPLEEIRRFHPGLLRRLLRLQSLPSPVLPIPEAAMGAMSLLHPTNAAHPRCRNHFDPST